MRLLEETSEILEVKTTPIERDFFVDWKDILGSGCSGHVRYCIELMTGKEFALKILLDNPQSRKEAYMHQQLSGHPHIVSLHRVYHNSISLSEDQDATPKNRLLLVMEMMTGGSLIKRLRREKTDEATVARYMSQIVDAVKYIHGLEIAHRDIKPDNILVSDNTEDAVVKLADFGFAKEDRCGLKSPSFTASYVAPEVIKVVYGDRMSEDIGMQSYDKSCDMWSLGVTMFCLLCKHHPFEYKNEDLRAMIMRILLGNYQFLSEEWNTISEEAKDIVRRLLQVEPSERMTVEELADHPWLKKTYSVASSDVSPSSSFMLTDEESVSPSYSFILTDEERVTHLQSTPESHSAATEAALTMWMWQSIRHTRKYLMTLRSVTRRGSIFTM